MEYYFRTMGDLAAYCKHYNCKALAVGVHPITRFIKTEIKPRNGDEMPPPPYEKEGKTKCSNI